MKDKETVSWQDRKASERFAMISPLLADDIDPAKKSQLRSRIAEANNISERTLYRLEAAWRRDGYSGLRPVNRQSRRSKKLPENFDEIIMQAVQLKKEVPSRSVARIILILEMEGWVLPGAIKRSSLQRYLYKEGFGVKQMKRYTEARNATSRRFCKPHRMMLAQCDIKYGLKLPIGKGGKKVQTYLSALIDDHSRFVLESGWYDNQEALIVEDTFHKAILRRGVMDAVYADNGRQYVSKDLTRALDDIRFLYITSHLNRGPTKLFQPFPQRCVAFPFRIFFWNEFFTCCLYGLTFHFCICPGIHFGSFNADMTKEISYVYEINPGSHEPHRC